MNESLVLEDVDNTLNEDEDARHRICYPSKYSEKVYDIYFSRYKLYKTYYMSLKANGVDLMLAKILEEANKMFNYTRACEELRKGSCNKYIKLTDSILERIDDAYERVL